MDRKTQSLLRELWTGRATWGQTSGHFHRALSAMEPQDPNPFSGPPNMAVWWQRASMLAHAQDSNQALFASIRSLFQEIADNQTLLETWLANNPVQVKRYQQLLSVQEKLYRKLQPLGSPRADWRANEFNLGTTLEDEPLRNLWVGLGSWRTLFPRKASDTIVRVFLEHGASVWVLRTNQVGGHDPDIEPISPITL